MLRRYNAVRPPQANAVRGVNGAKAAARPPHSKNVSYLDNLE